MPDRWHPRLLRLDCDSSQCTFSAVPGGRSRAGCDAISFNHWLSVFPDKWIQPRPSFCGQFSCAELYEAISETLVITGPLDWLLTKDPQHGHSFEAWIAVTQFMK
ncbi:hypothetical protein O181_090424 [Austropuccinia psidii MF-1]|uniref:Uncharacterized protein n=1 Tax=Austropuccinia psidii MF-1 TaxID=1389203 RepID=A0A9Q3IVE6_9BASI|nr:hypothetical protein [Austropuccinia psidii MF-1]